MAVSRLPQTSRASSAPIELQARPAATAPTRRSVDWSASTIAVRSAAADVGGAIESAFSARGAPQTLASARGVGVSIGANLRQQPWPTTWQETRVGGAGVADAVLLCADANVAVVCADRVAGEAVHSAVAWWPPAVEGAPAALYTIEALWDEEGALVCARWVEFPCA